ncbi:peptidoglycan-binding domain-containing protein [Rhizobium ruizarguesonis]|uniref:peptidoglycan-binding domain-containing protein n=1 Tax=Rhizobium ruizarguesonis TaxID=2081791 RepID=UPI0013EE70BE|nr:peptidoglycan-binding domain-containing protein [Rhizobium ruizarguesonis]
MRRIALALASIMLFVSGVRAQQIPSEMPDFDRQVGFTEPLLTPVFRSYGDEHLYFVLPNVLNVDKLSSGSPDITLLYDRQREGRHAILTISGTVGYARDHDEAINQVKQLDGAARFAAIEPNEFGFMIRTPGSEGGEATIESAKIDSARHFEILVRAADITTRILLVPASYKFDSIAVVYSPKYRGVVRDANGVAQVGVRAYEVGSVVSGGCALQPDRFVSWRTLTQGCIHPQYSRRLIRPLQERLKEKDFYDGIVDGAFGPLTERAIRKYQSAHSLVVDGVPSADLADAVAR